MNVVGNVPEPAVVYTDMQFRLHVVLCLQEVIKVPAVPQEELPVEVPQVMVVVFVTQKSKHTYQPVNKQIPMYSSVAVEVPATVQEGAAGGGPACAGRRVHHECPMPRSGV